MTKQHKMTYETSACEDWAYFEKGSGRFFLMKSSFSALSAVSLFQFSSTMCDRELKSLSLLHGAERYFCDTSAKVGNRTLLTPQYCSGLSSRAQAQWCWFLLICYFFENTVQTASGLNLARLSGMWFSMFFRCFSSEHPLLLQLQHILGLHSSTDVWEKRSLYVKQSIYISCLQISLWKSVTFESYFTLI